MAGKKSPSIFSTLQKTTENASAVNGELTRQLPVASLVDNPMNRFSMAEDDEFLSTMRSVEQDGFLEDIVVTPDGENTWRIISAELMNLDHLFHHVPWCCNITKSPSSHCKCLGKSIDHDRSVFHLWQGCDTDVISSIGKF